MNRTDIVSTTMKINNMTDLNTYILTDEEKGYFFHHENISIPSFMPGANGEDLHYIFEQVTFLNNRIYDYTNEWGLHYLAYTFIDKQRYLIIIGPYMELTPDLYQLTRQYQLSNNETKDLANFCTHIQVLSPEKINSFSSILQTFEQLINLNNTPIRIEISKKKEKSKVGEFFEFQNEANEIIKMRYKVEGDFIQAVEEGNSSKALKILHSNEGLFSFLERLPNQPLRRLKNFAVITNTLLRMSARKKKVPTLNIHIISEKYAHNIEYVTQISKLQELQGEMVKEYIQLINSASLSQYSKITQKAIEYLLHYYNEKIDRTTLADVCFTHISHLSRKFKQETNMTITEYQQMLRVNKAKYLLKHENVSIEEIAWIVGYNDAAYFSKVFKKDTGYTPSEYKNEDV